MSALARAAAVAVIGALALATAACTDASPTPTPLSTPTAETPIFASDEEALAAAEGAYARYVAIDAEIGAAGGEGAERIGEVVAEPYAGEIVEDYDAMMSRGYRTSGTITADRFQLVQRERAGASETIQVYACVGVGNTRILDATGADVTPPERTAVVPMIVEFLADADGVKVSGSAPWSGENFCA